MTQENFRKDEKFEYELRSCPEYIRTMVSQKLLKYEDALQEAENRIDELKEHIRNFTGPMDKRLSEAVECITFYADTDLVEIDYNGAYYKINIKAKDFLKKWGL